MGLFSDIYNTVAKFFRPQEEQGDASKSVATNRLKLVLMQDRTNLTPKILEQMRGELIDLLSRYVELDKELLELNFEQEGEQVALMLSIPVIRAKDEEEIEEALRAKEEAEKAEVSESEEVANEAEEGEISEENEVQDITDETADEECSEDDNDSVKNVSAPNKKNSSKKDSEEQAECTTEA